MNNKDFWNSIKKYGGHRNRSDDELVCDMMVKEGLGQTVGGYFEVAKYSKYKRIIDRSKAEPSQAFHFFEYYIDNEKNNRSEMAGLDRQILLGCLKYIRETEESKGLIGMPKGGGYLEKIKLNNDENRLKEFKKKIHISEIQSIISEGTSYEEVVQKVSLIAR